MRNKLLLVIAFILLTTTVYADPDNQSTIIAGGGNTTALDFGTIQISDMWQGFYGTVSGGMILSDGSNHTFYDWSLTRANGEIIASRNIITDWSQVDCSTQQEIYAEQERLHMENSSTANINRTYVNSTHPSFEVGGVVLDGCRSTLTNNVTSRSSVFWNVVINTNATNTAYVSLMDDDQVGFNGTISDFQLLVPVDRTIGYNVYIIYVELS